MSRPSSRSQQIATIIIMLLSCVYVARGLLAAIHGEYHMAPRWGKPITFEGIKAVYLGMIDISLGLIVMAACLETFNVKKRIRIGLIAFFCASALLFSLLYFSA